MEEELGRVYKQRKLGLCKRRTLSSGGERDSFVPVELGPVEGLHVLKHYQRASKASKRTEKVTPGELAIHL